MPAEYRIDPEQRVIHSRAWGQVTDRELSRNRTAMLGDSAFSPDFRQLYDLSGITELAVTPAGVRALAQSSPFPADAVRAFVVASDVVYGMVRMYSILGDRDEDRFRIFRDHAAALAWLLTR